ncbi:MAG: hypothetical protein MI919_37390 [Holophagales bacterium]|nr:hypothetical protein [Holophagales bacterium]
MKKQHYLVALAALLLVGFVVGGALERRRGISPAELVSSDSLRPQEAEERIFEAPATEKIWTLGGDDHDVLFGPLLLEIGPSGHLFVADYGDLSVEEFDADGRHLRSYGAGKGQGPGELLSITDLDFQGDELWIADQANSQISIFHRADGRLLRTLPTEVLPYRLTARRDGGFTLLSLVQVERLFHRFDASGRPLGSFGQLIRQQVEKGLTLDGWMEGDGRGGVVYTGFYVGLLGRWSAEGEPVFLRESIAPQPLPRLVRSGDSLWVDRDSPIHALGLQVTAEHIHVFGTFEDGIHTRGALDTYRLEGGTYLHSRRNPEPCRQVRVDGGFLYTVGDTHVSKWRLPAR